MRYGRSLAYLAITATSSRLRPALSPLRRRKKPSWSDIPATPCVRPGLRSVIRLRRNFRWAWRLRRFRSHAARCFRRTTRPDWRLKHPGNRARLLSWEPATGRARVWLWSRRSNRQAAGLTGKIMTAPRDKFGRPIVVVTGMGVVTSLGAGKADNWAKPTAGEFGVRTRTR